jgi:hypothetical protein
MAVEDRASLLEHDVDDLEAAVNTHTKLLIGILVATTASAISLALNILIGMGGG